MKTIGRIDKADFPELHLSNISVKIDTGAYTSSIHSHDIQEVMIDGEMFLEFFLLDPTHPKFNNKKFQSKHYSSKSIKNSFGLSEQRFVVDTTIVIFGEEFPIELSLSERGNMKYPILLGRKVLNGRFYVDTSQQNLSFKEKKKSLKNIKK